MIVEPYAQLPVAIVRRGVKTHPPPTPYFKNNLPILVNPPFLKIPEPLPPTFKAKLSIDLQFYR